MSTAFPPKCIWRVSGGSKGNVYQLYQPGFNESNGCWLHGRWVNAKVKSDGEWGAVRDAHIAMYGNLEAECKHQHHSSKGVDPKDMTPAQKKAWEFDSGLGSLYVLCKDGIGIQPIGIQLRGGKAPASQIAWIRDREWRVITIVKAYKKTYPQPVEEYGIPKDLWVSFDPMVDLNKGYVVPKGTKIS